MQNNIIAMWSGPRNLSTAVMRSFENRQDVTKVIDEPFYGAYLKNLIKITRLKKMSSALWKQTTKKLNHFVK